MRTITTILFGIGLLAMASAAEAGDRVTAFTGHVYDLDRHQQAGRHHRHGKHCRHGRDQRRGPGCYESREWVRSAYGRRLLVSRTMCRDRHGRAYAVPGTAQVIRRHR